MYLNSISLDLLWNMLQLLFSTFTASSTIFFIFLSTFIGPASARSYTIGVVGNWIVGNAVFSKTALTIFFGLWSEVSTKYDLEFEWNLFFRKICNLEIFDLEIVIKLPKLKFFAIFSTLHHQFSFIFHAMTGGRDV